MSSSRPTPTRHPTLDEQSFQGLLSAAFIIQEHNNRRRLEQSDLTPPEPIQRTEEPLDFRVREEDEPQEHNESHNDPDTQTQMQHPEQLPEKQPAASLAREVATVCRGCGALKPPAASPCPKCGLDQFRPGERLQRNWASMWLMSQQQGLWPERSPEVDQAVQKIRKELPSRVPQLRSKSTLLSRSASEPSAVDQFASARDVAHQDSDRLPDTLESSALDRFFPEDAESGVPPSDTTADNIVDPIDDAIAEPAARHAAPKSLMQRLAELSVTVRFHRADLYLGLALFVAILALLWPAAAAPHRHALGPWERTLIALGIAEAPTPPVVRIQGDPGIQVWVDTHSALYYCPGEEQYGKTPGGHVTTQHEAQMDRFQPAGRSVCD